jgi:RNA polymerase sigma-70 factor (ECF subfamily)
MAKSEVTESGLTKLLESRGQFLNFLKKRVSSPDVAEELLQNAFLKTIEKSGDIRNAESIVAWFYRVLRNSVIDHYRSSGRNQQELLGILNDLERYASAVPEPENEVCQCIHPLLENLKPEYREALTTIDLGDGSLADLASRAGITEGNAAVRIHRARQAMLKQVQMTCGACAEHHCVDCHCKHD